MGVFRPKLEILPASQRALWPQLRAAADGGFVLYGGTAIALRLGHRSSVDFDFFRSAELDREELHRSMLYLKDTDVFQEGRNTLVVSTKPGEVKVSFFGGIGFGRYGEPDWTDDGNVRVATLDDLMATKLKVILQRTEARDFKDIIAMAKHGVSIERGLAIAEQLYRPQFPPMIAVKALTYFEDGDAPELKDDERVLLIELAKSVRQLPEVRITPDLSAPISTPRPGG